MYSAPVCLAGQLQSARKNVTVYKGRAVSASPELLSKQGCKVHTDTTGTDATNLFYKECQWVWPCPKTLCGEVPILSCVGHFSPLFHYGVVLLVVL